MFPLPSFYFHADRAAPDFEDSKLVPLPAELGDKVHITTYQSAKLGWNRCQLGYSFFVRERIDGTRHVIAGIVLDDDKPRKRLYFPPLRVNKHQVEAIVSQLEAEEKQALQALEDAKRATTAELILLVHDLRQLSSAIYNAAFQARADFDKRPHQSRDLIDTVLATQALLSVRIDALDLSSNPELHASQTIAVYRKVDKMVRSLRQLAENKRIELTLTGSSFGQAWGPDVFELIPFSLIENAIKYSPVGNNVTVKVLELSDSIKIEVTSLGPQIELDEFTKIFDRHYRGRNASETGRTGSGIGLERVRMLVEDYFHGRVWATQETQSRLQIGTVPYHNVTFHVEVPRRE
ncbi:sensor histidine kinase [Bradyrhizobium aeschynomenes]|uniref:sensor histidine kinase n=1 Tax=Bradyrhizobium aeschynomenes TaxID=2734909 RepID=UPI001555E687|nr:HAMP domain-containing sensor histidine kinase [Bradyrhizobium aeschynomenes]NPV22129.1 HAMP domain-containing histidine kinase [Bradyrhizobium aeschynomenes]